MDIQKSTFEKYLFPLENIDSPSLHEFTEEKRKLWPQRLEEAKDKNKRGDYSNVELYPSPSSPTRGIIVLVCHNVFDSDLEKFVCQCSKWNALGFEVHVCSFVGRGSPIHASLLACFEDTSVQHVIKSLLVVFDRKHILKGKGVVIKRLLEDGNLLPLYFVDDGAENLKNVFKATGERYLNLHLIHYVAVPSTQKYQTPVYAKRVTAFEDLVELVNILLKKICFVTVKWRR